MPVQATIKWDLGPVLEERVRQLTWKLHADKPLGVVNYRIMGEP